MSGVFVPKYIELFYDSEDIYSAIDIDSRALMMQGIGFPYIIYEKAILLTGNWVELEILCESCEKKYLFYHNQLGLKN